MHVPAVPLRKLSEDSIVPFTRQERLDVGLGLPVLLNRNQINDMARKIKTAQNVVLAAFRIDGHIVDLGGSMMIDEELIEGYGVDLDLHSL